MFLVSFSRLRKSLLCLIYRQDFIKEMGKFGAGILAISSPRPGICAVLLSHSTRRDEFLDILGGKQEPIDQNDPMKCAIREFLEESSNLGGVLTEQNCLDIFDTQYQLGSFINTGFFCYAYAVPYVHPLILNSPIYQIAYSNTNFTWVDINTLINKGVILNQRLRHYTLPSLLKNIRSEFYQRFQKIPDLCRDPGTPSPRLYDTFKESTNGGHRPSTDNPSFGGNTDSPLDNLIKNLTLINKNSGIGGSHPTIRRLEKNFEDFTLKECWLCSKRIHLLSSISTKKIKDLATRDGKDIITYHSIRGTQCSTIEPIYMDTHPEESSDSSLDLWILSPSIVSTEGVCFWHDHGDIPNFLTDAEIENFKARTKIAVVHDQQVLESSFIINDWPLELFKLPEFPVQLFELQIEANDTQMRILNTALKEITSRGYHFVDWIVTPTRSISVTNLV